MPKLSCAQIKARHRGCRKEAKHKVKRAAAHKARFIAKAKRASKIYQHAKRRGRSLTWKEAQKQAWSSSGGSGRRSKRRAIRSMSPSY